MLLSFQFPFLDIRSFINNPTYRLECYDINHPVYLNQEFIRSFGSIKERFNSNQTAERYYCTANKAVVLDEKNSFIYGNNRKFNTKYVFKRFFSNGINCRLDLGVKNILHSKYSYEYLKEIIISILNSKAKVKKSNIKLYNIGKALSELYIHSTTQKPKKNIKEVSPKWVINGNPMLLIEVEDNYLGNLPTSFQLVETNELKQWGVSLYYTIINNKEKTINLSTWVLCKSRNCNKDNIRNLRIYLMKMHQERECFCNLISAIRSRVIVYPSSSEEVNSAIEDYVDCYYKNFCREKHYGVSNNIVLSTVNEIDKIVNTYQREQLLEQCAGTKLYKFIKDIIKEGTMRNDSKQTTYNFNGTVNGPVTGPVYGGNVTGDYANSDNTALQLKINELETFIKSLENPTDEIRELSNCVQEISKQVKSGISPDKKTVLEKLGDSLTNIPKLGMLITSIIDLIK